MRLEEVHINNFRQYKNADFDFTKKDDDYDMNIIVGKNGVGKTTFLNAINWCLYGEELHSVYTKDSDKLPLFRLKADKENDIISVYLKVSTESNGELVYRRDYDPKKGKERFTVIETFSNGESNIYHDAEADMRVDQFVPGVIKDFFFFDGEHLDNYFLDTKTKNIKDMVSVMSHIDLLDNITEKLEEKVASFKRKASNVDSRIDELNGEIEFDQKNKNKLKEEIKSKEKDVALAEERIQKLTFELENFKDIRKFEEERVILKNEIESIYKKITDSELDMESCILKHAPKILLHDAIEYVLNVEIENKADELPPKIDKIALEESIEDNICKICGRPLNEEIAQDLEKKLDQYELSSEQSKILIELDKLLQVPNNAINTFISEKKALSKYRNSLMEEYKKKSQRLNEIENYIKMSSNADSSAKFEEREELEKQIANNYKIIANRKERINTIDKELFSKNIDLNDLMKKNEAATIFAKRKLLCEQALNTVKESKQEIMEDTKDNVERITNETFFKLLWKKGTYDFIDIDENYNLKLIHNETKGDSLGSASAAERELLALAFTLGVHNISGFNSPLLIDTPLARVSDEHRVNFANVLLNVSKDKQIILLFTPAEFSDDIKEILDIPEVKKYKISMDSSEEFSTAEEYVNGGL